MVTVIVLLPGRARTAARRSSAGISMRNTFRWSSAFLGCSDW